MLILAPRLQSALLLYLVPMEYEIVKLSLDPSTSEIFYSKAYGCIIVLEQLFQTLQAFFSWPKYLSRTLYNLTFVRELLQKEFDI